MRLSLRSGSDAIERALQTERPEPGAAFVADLSARITSSRKHEHRQSRLAFVAALSVLVVGTFLSFGGAAYAASDAAQKQAAPASKSAAADEYGEQSVAEVPQDPQTPATQDPVTAVAGATAAAPQSGTLPFTGIGLGSTVLVSMLLVMLGLYLRRRESRE